MERKVKGKKEGRKLEKKEKEIKHLKNEEILAKICFIERKEGNDAVKKFENKKNERKLNRDVEIF